MALAGAAVAQDTDRLALQRDAYDAVQAKSVIDLQMFRDTTAATDAATGQHVTLISLNPGVGAWYLLQLRDDPEGKADDYHLENPAPDSQSVVLRPGSTPALIVTTAKGEVTCTPWADGAAALIEARKSGVAYAPICDGALFLRNRVTGARTSIETATDFLRDNVWGGETIVRFVRDNFYKDSQLETSIALGTGGEGGVNAGPVPMRGKGGPGGPASDFPPA